MTRGWSLPESTLVLLLFWFLLWLRALRLRKCSFQQQFRLCWKAAPARDSGLQKHGNNFNSSRETAATTQSAGSVTQMHFLSTQLSTSSSYVWFWAVNNMNEWIKEKSSEELAKLWGKSKDFNINLTGGQGKACYKHPRPRERNLVRCDTTLFPSSWFNQLHLTRKDNCQHSVQGSPGKH